MSDIAAVTYSYQRQVDPGAVADLFRAAALFRPIDDRERIRTMIENSQLVISAWSGDRLVAFARALTDFTCSALLTDLVVHPDFRRRGIGTELLERMFETGADVTYVFRSASAPDAYVILAKSKLASASALMPAGYETLR
jgi:GNAT superfamily N-acetyltransferase